MSDPPRCQTVTLPLSDAAIRRHAADLHTRDLRDSRRPVVLRYHADRTRGTWYIVIYHKDHSNPWHRVGTWPLIPTAAVFEKLPGLILALTTDPTAAGSIDGWSTVAELLTWFRDRSNRDRNASKKRKAAIRSIIKCHLLPRLGAVPVLRLTMGRLDDLLIWPLQETYSLAYVRQVFGVLMKAFKQATTLKLITSNPLHGFRLPDFITAGIEAKPGAIRPDQVPAVLRLLIERRNMAPADVALALMMLCHGTRIGETRLAKWRNVNLEDGEWYIPAADAKTRAEYIAPMTLQVCAYLRRYRGQQKAAGYTGAYLYPAHNGQPLDEKQADKVFIRLGQGEWTSHDLRKVARTCWADLGVDHQVGEFLLNHKLQGTSKAYIHTQLRAQKRAALELWHAWLDARGFAQLHGLDAVTGPQSFETAIPLHPNPGAAYSGV
jgi:integrase